VRRSRGLGDVAMQAAIAMAARFDLLTRHAHTYQLSLVPWMSCSGDAGHCMDARLPSWECGDKMPHSCGGPRSQRSCGAQPGNDMNRQIHDGPQVYTKECHSHMNECTGRPRLLMTTLVLLGTSRGLDLSPLGVRGSHPALRPGDHGFDRCGIQQARKVMRSRDQRRSS
jgi:hypothetical protein